MTFLDSATPDLHLASNIKHLVHLRDKLSEFRQPHSEEELVQDRAGTPRPPSAHAVCQGLPSVPLTNPWVSHPCDPPSQQDSAPDPDTWTTRVTRRLDCRCSQVTLKGGIVAAPPPAPLGVFGAVNAYFFENRDCTGLNKKHSFQRYIIHLEILHSFPVCDNN